MLLPFYAYHLMSCIDTIQSGLDQNFMLEGLILSKEIVFQRNEHTSKLELVKDCKLYHFQSNQAANCIEQIEHDDEKHPIAVPQCVGMSSALPQLGSSSIQTQCRISSRNSQAKQIKVGKSSRESPCQSHQVHVEPQPQPPATVTSNPLPTVLHSPSCAPSYYYFSSHSTTARHHCMPGSFSIHNTMSYRLPSRNYPPQEQDHQQNQSMTNTWTHSPYGQGVTFPPVRLTPPIMMQSQPYPCQQQTHESFPQSHINSLLHHQSTVPHPRFHAGMNSQQTMLLGNAAIPPYPPSMIPPQPGRMPLAAAHVQHPSLEPAQHHPATAPPLWTAYSPSTTQTPSTYY